MEILIKRREQGRKGKRGLKNYLGGTQNRRHVNNTENRHDPKMNCIQEGKAFE